MASPIFETPWRKFGTNPRGGHRGGRGVCVCDGQLLIANSDEIHVFDPAWRTTNVLSHPLIGDIHGLAPTSDGVWVCASRADSMVRIGWDGAVRETWTWRADPTLVKRFGYRTVAPIDQSRDYRDMRQLDGITTDLSHPNSAREVEDGLLVSLGRVRIPSPSRRERAYEALGAAARAAVVGRPVVRRLRAARVRQFGADPQPGHRWRGALIRIGRDGRTRGVGDRHVLEWPSHGVVPLGREVVFCVASRALLVACHTETGAERAVPVPRASGFLRGLAWLDGDRFLAGADRPASLHTIDLESGETSAVLTLSDEPNESVHNISPLPEAWDDPPPALI